MVDKMLVFPCTISLILYSAAVASLRFRGNGRLEILSAGDRRHVPHFGSIVRVHYTGMLENGRVFDSSRKRGKPIEFKLGLGRVIPCWEDAIANMSVGEHAKLTCPPDVAYGNRGRPPKIPPEATLQFDIELVDCFDRR
mmetsp:Transcript_85718/g.135370  ORF Transcript_85718/g.135370 Transcript_85718/m.135370 type:complete len:139 (-) Transcript_85718:36-452(-)